MYSNPDERPTVLELMEHPFVSHLESDFDFDVWIKAAMAKRAILLAERKANHASSESSEYDSNSEEQEEEEVEEQEEVEMETDED